MPKAFVVLKAAPLWDDIMDFVSARVARTNESGWWSLLARFREPRRKILRRVLVQRERERIAIHRLNHIQETEIRRWEGLTF